MMDWLIQRMCEEQDAMEKGGARVLGSNYYYLEHDARGESAAGPNSLVGEHGEVIVEICAWTSRVIPFSKVTITMRPCRPSVI